MGAWDFYIAHAEVDRGRARELAAALEARGRQAYVPGAAAWPGDDAEAADEQALRRARCCVALLTPQGLGDARRRCTVALALERVRQDPRGRRRPGSG